MLFLFFKEKEVYQWSYFIPFMFKITKTYTISNTGVSVGRVWSTAESLT